MLGVEADDGSLTGSVQVSKSPLTAHHPSETEEKHTDWLPLSLPRQPLIRPFPSAPPSTWSHRSLADESRSDR